MTALRPRAVLPTHEVLNMPPPMGDQDLWGDDAALRDAVVREGAAWAAEGVAAFGREVGSAETFEKADEANRRPPELHAFDGNGMRIDQVRYHPAYHELMALAVRNGVAGFAWTHAGPGSHVGHMALTYLFSQAEGGVMCPMAMTYSAIPTLRMGPPVADEWIPRVLSAEYDGRDMPVRDKSGATVGMFMTEKQGGSDVRTNTMRAEPREGAWRLHGHKFFCSAPMSDAFLTLAYTDTGLSCFLVPRWRPDGERNGLFLQRLKDKLGNRSNASAEIEFVDCHGELVGEEGRGVRTIIEMVQGNRLYCCVSSAALMRQALVRALHHARNRSAFQRRLADQPAMCNVLADLALEAEAALVLGMRIARAVDEAEADPAAAALARIGTAVGKYWNCRRAPGMVFEALECLGGPGYVEDGPLARMYREAPLNSIWEGAGNVICLDVLRAMDRDGATVAAVLDELDAVRGGNTLLDGACDALRGDIARTDDLEWRARDLTERLALVLQGALLVRHAPDAVGDAFCASRLGPARAGAYGTLPTGTDAAAILERAYAPAA